MNKYYYDFHIHSCLSPCADNDMTPNNIAGVGTLAGLNVMALTDHNSSKNCPAFFEAAKRNGIIPIAGMELTTAEDIHVVCLFEKLENAMKFDAFVDEHRMKIKNRVDIFGDQLICDGEDNVIGNDDYLLTNATDIPIDDARGYVKSFGGIAYPAHIDREANGIIATLGTFPEECGFKCAEFYDENKTDEYLGKYPVLNDKKLLISSDAHYLWDIKDKRDYFEIDDEPYSSDKVRHEIFNILRTVDDN